MIYEPASESTVANPHIPIAETRPEYLFAASIIATATQAADGLSFAAFSLKAQLEKATTGFPSSNSF